MISKFALEVLKKKILTIAPPIILNTEASQVHLRLILLSGTNFLKNERDLLMKSTDFNSNKYNLLTEIFSH